MAQEILSVGDLWSEDVGLLEGLGKGIQAISGLGKRNSEGWGIGRQVTWCADPEARVAGSECAGMDLLRR